MPISPDFSCALCLQIRTAKVDCTMHTSVDFGCSLCVQTVKVRVYAYVVLIPICKTSKFSMQKISTFCFKN
jgi:hypothetical protein